ncbi:pyridoxamine 5'-phosphate oxidase family protein [Actinoplanes octamycinicus]|uniref:Pyridoxamine 5'-phosphate oxidase family protein n=1 Tax=Actinoplanes octamycinicus TaxID=135948 RepID=A0A7W7GZK1_9ACTN|nr:PPOX class F420-dependent oxidoreductase [Actinoplanes octamycinicus]MBB4741221.1 pyridoxamine 5'-phosphate oxidase family protein [Actinoplanes octamycinicus]GIE56128.1 PPOX class F420-dependent oxidoreductase [Actinoplanes octamycinicus]
MTFTDFEIAYLAEQRLGRLATLRPDGTLQNSPVGFRYNPATETIDIVGFRLAASHKFRNVAATGEVAFVVDDLYSTDPWRVRCLEIRGRAEAIEQPADSAYGTPEPIIRIRARRIISFGIDDPNRPPHELVPHNRTVSTAA